MEKLIEDLDKKWSVISKMYFWRLARDYIVKNSRQHITFDLLREFMQLSTEEELTKVLADEEDSLTKLFEYLNDDTILKQEVDMSYPSLISSYDEWSFYKFMSSKKNDFEDCLSQISKIPFDRRLFRNEENKKEFSEKTF